MAAIHVTHLIPTLGIGGSETMLLKLAQHTNRQRYQLSIITFWQDNTLAHQFNALGIKVYQLNRRRSLFPMATLWEVRRVLHQLQPDVVHAWLYPSFLFSLVCTGYSFRPAIIWNIRHAPNCIQSKTGKILGWLCRKLVSYVPNVVISCSQQAALAHQKQGWQTPMYCIPNGFVLAKTTSSPTKALVIGKIARFTSAKDHQTFIRAAHLFRQRFPQTIFILCGKDCDESNAMLIDLLERHAIKSAFRLLGEQSNIGRVIDQLQICTLSSFTEGFPNVLGEAICQGVMCIATEAGETATLLGNKQWVTPIGDAQALSLAWQRFVDLAPAQQIGVRNSQYQHLSKCFDIQKIVQKYEQVYEGLVNC